jgi:hypothetical protein
MHSCDAKLDLCRAHITARQQITQTASIVSALFATLPFAVIAVSPGNVQYAGIRNALRIICCLASLCSVLSTVGDMGEIKLLANASELLCAAKDVHGGRKEAQELAQHYLSACHFTALSALNSATSITGFLGLMAMFVLFLVDNFPWASAWISVILAAAAVILVVSSAFLWLIRCEHAVMPSIACDCLRHDLQHAQQLFHVNMSCGDCSLQALLSMHTLRVQVWKDIHPPEPKCPGLPACICPPVNVHVVTTPTTRTP